MLLTRLRVWLQRQTLSKAPASAPSPHSGTIIRRLALLSGILLLALGLTNVILQTHLDTTSTLIPASIRPKSRPAKTVSDADSFRESLYAGEAEEDLVLRVYEPIAEHTHSVLVLHGLWDIVPFGDIILHQWSPQFPGVRWFSPRSGTIRRPDGEELHGWYTPWRPNILYDSRSGFEDAWDAVAHNLYRAFDDNGGEADVRPKVFDNPVLYDSSDFWEDEEGQIKSARQLAKLLNEQIIGSGPGQVSWDKLIVLGFSQGGVMALLLSTTLPQPPAGVMLYSAYLPMRLHPQRLHFNPHVNITWCHGTKDHLFGPPIVEYSLDVLRTLGYDVDFEWEEDRVHTFGPSEMQNRCLERLMAKAW